MKISRASAVGVLAALALPSFALAVNPPPGGGYPGENTALGDDALFSLTTGTNDSANGYDALYHTTTGSSNTANGHNALFYNTSGPGNTADGEDALYSDTFGAYNTAAGISTSYNNTTGAYNVALGAFALYVNTGGSHNIALGDYALELLHAGNNNIGIGQKAGLKLFRGDWNIYIGTIGAKKTESGTIRIGDAARYENTYIAGISGRTVANGAAVMVNERGRLGTVTSSARYTDNIQPMRDASDVLLSLQPVSFRYNQELDSLGTPQFGLVAEEVAKVDPDLVVRDEQGHPYTVRYEAVNAMLLNEFLKEHRKLEDLEKTVAELKSALRAQAALIEKVSAQMRRAPAMARLVSAAP